MPPRKPSVHRKSNGVESQLKGSFHINDNDCLPDLLVDFIEDLPVNYGDDDRADSNRPAKRRKTVGTTDYVAVHREVVSFKNPYSGAPTARRKASIRHDIGPHVAFHVSYPGPPPSRGQPRSVALTLESRQRYRNSKLRADLCTIQAVSEELSIVLEHAAKSGPTNTNQGALWTAVDISLKFIEEHTILSFEFELRWNESSYVSWELHTEPQRHLRELLLNQFYPETHNQASRWNREKRSPQDFYEAAFVTNQDDAEPESFYVPGLTATLYPFQKRAVRWLLNREGVCWTEKASDEAPGVIPLNHDVSGEVSTHFTEVKDADNNLCYISNLYGIVTKDPTPFVAYENEMKGGILSEEMGLGKTLEIISLILLHRRPVEPPTVIDTYLGAEIRPTGATLIITPPSLKDQWLSELNRHAPRLRVMEYAGIRKSCNDELTETALVNKLAEQDVVVTTYSELRNELHFALDPPARAMRNERKHHRPKSPLVQISWWRVCLDEAQEVENGVSNTATLARIIPRVNAWGVTGTPIKDDVQDLWGLLLFLRYHPYASVKKIWQDLVLSHRDTFHNLFNRIALRHTKRLIRDELYLPSQKRYVITMPFTAVEEQHYQSLFKDMAEACGLDTQGVPLKDAWDPEDPAVLEAMRTALDRLRQTALHPEVGARNRRALGHRSGPMRTVAEVLDAMIEQSENATIIDQRALLSGMLTRAQLFENSPRVNEALAIWEEALRASDVLVQESREHLQLEIDQAETSESEAADQGDESGDDDPETSVPPRVGEAQRRLRYALEIQHRAVFFCANAHFQIKSDEETTEPDSEEFKRLEKLETEGYERAKLVRREILQDSHRKATQFMRKVSGKAAKQDFAVIPEFRSLARKGIESRPVIDALEELGDALNEQANQLDEWREQIVQLLLKELVDEDDDVELTGDEYADSTKVQEDLIALVTVLRATIADRQTALSGQSLSKLTEDEIKQSIQLASRGEGPSPEKLLQLFALRERIRPEATLGSLRGTVTDLRDISTKLRNQTSGGNSRARVELEIAMQQLKDTQAQLTEQTKVATAMEQEIDKFTRAMNARVDYYRQLQTVSDQVAAYEGPTDDAAMAALLREEENLKQKSETSQSKHRYLLHLKDADSKEEQRMCVICQSTFTIGVLTVCGHQFCKDCITLWFKAHRNCPMCKRRLHAANLHDITLKPQELKVHSEVPGNGEPPNSQQSPKSKKTGIYSDFGAEKLAEIKNIDLPGPSYTTKVDTLVRHLLWLRESDPGAKSIVFSQYPDFLRVVGTAFRRHQIGFTAFSDHNGITSFKEDPGIECFLLHARAHSSGLNLVNASHVILCEPLLNTALELQAIARVDRIGQEHETTVWLYIVDGTVEESIYNLSVQRRMDHMGRNLKGKSKESTPELLDSSLEVANSLEMQEARLSKLMGKGKMAGEEVPQSDLWACLFGTQGRSRDNEDKQLRNEPLVRRFLAGEAAQSRIQPLE